MIKKISWLLCVFLVGASGLSAEEPTPLYTLNGHGNSVDALVFSHDGKTLVSGGVDGVIKFWDVSTGKPVATLQEAGIVKCLSFLPKGKILVSAGLPPIARSTGLASAPPIALWDIAKKKKIATLGENSGYVISMAVSPNGKIIATGFLVPGNFDGDSCRVDLWNIKSHKKTITLPLKAPVSSLAFSPDGKTLATADGIKIKLWNVVTGRRLATLRGHTVLARSVMFSPNGKLLASGSLDGTIRLWDVATQKNKAILKRDPIVPVDSIAFHPKGKVLASGYSDGVIQLWDVATAKKIASFKTHPGGVICVAFSPDGKTLASSNANTDGTIQLWDVNSLRKEGTKDFRGN